MLHVAVRVVEQGDQPGINAFACRHHLDRRAQRIALTRDGVHRPLWLNEVPDVFEDDRK